MEKYEVGYIQEYPVYFIKEKNMLYCKDVTIPYDKIRDALFKSSLDRVHIKSDITVIKDNSLITIGCLNTTIENLTNINKNIKKLKHVKSIIKEQNQ